ncbi:MAG: hypothetical protein GC150_15115 [Rhizobiales bacterium]|nr:hypothetical protein [Hyphomicrobiales bacterium]
MPRFLAALLLATVLAAPAAAGPQYVDASTFAASGYDVVAYHDLAQVAPGKPQPAAVPGSAAITAENNGALWAFSSEENRARFVADPARYAPAFDGHCAFGVSKGYKVPANPHLWRIVDGRLYLNYSTQAARLWERGTAKHIKNGERAWRSGLDGGPASREAVPDLDVAQAPRP